MRRTLAAFLLLAGLVGLPNAAAQLDKAVDRCTQQCDPKADDVNGPTIRTGTETVKTVLYFHYEDLLQNAAINAQAPCEECANAEANLEGGYLMPTLVTNSGQYPAGQQADVRFKSNAFGAYSSAGLVEVVDGVARTHQESGLADDVELLGKSIPLYFYLSVYPVPTSTREGPAGDNVVAAMPAVALHASMRLGRTPGSGPIIAEGDSAAAGRITMIKAPGQKDIYEFRVDMDILQPKLPSVWAGGDGFTVQVTPYQVRGDDPVKDYEFTQADWRVHVGPRTPPHMVVEIAKPIATKAMRANVYRDHLFVRWSVASPWGSYDVDDRSVTITVTGPSTPEPAKTGLSRPAFVYRSIDHNGHFKPVNFTWKFDYRKADLADGEYLARVAVTNLQGTYRLEESMPLTIRDGVPQNVDVIGGSGVTKGGSGHVGGKAPGTAGLGVLLALVAVATLRRGRKPTPA